MYMTSDIIFKTQTRFKIWGILVHFCAVLQYIIRRGPCTCAVLWRLPLLCLYIWKWKGVSEQQNGPRLEQHPTEVK